MVSLHTPNSRRITPRAPCHRAPVRGIRASPCFRWANTILANVKNSLLAAHRAVGAKTPAALASAPSAWRSQTDASSWKTIHERLAIAGTTTPPMPYRLLKLAEAPIMCYELALPKCLVLFLMD